MSRTKEKELTDKEKLRLRDRCRQMDEWEILSHETDEDHPMTKKKLIERLAKHNFKVTDDTLPRDIEAINMWHENDKPIAALTSGDGERLYWFKNHLFTPTELQVIYDALKACGIPEEDQNSLMRRVLSTASLSQAEKFSIPDEKKGREDKQKVPFLSKLQVVENACQNGLQLTIQYFYEDENHVHVLQRDGEKFLVEPAAVVFRNGHYYLIGWDCARNTDAHFRIDRMQTVICNERKNSEKRMFTDDELEEYICKSIDMFRGKECDVRLRLNDLKAVGIVYERFGNQAYIFKTKENVWVAQVKAQLSPKLWGWLCSENGLITLTEPDEALTAYIAWLNESLKVAKEEIT